MARLLAEDLYLVCWDRGRIHPSCRGSLPAGLAGALLLDAHRVGAISMEGSILRDNTTVTRDPLLLRVVRAVSGGGHAVLARDGVEKLARTAAGKVHDRLLGSGDLRRVVRFVFWRRDELADPAAVAALRARVSAVLVGQLASGDVSEHERLLAALTAPAGALPVLVRGSYRSRADVRARSELCPADARLLVEAIDVVADRIARRRREAARSRRRRDAARGAAIGTSFGGDGGGGGGLFGGGGGGGNGGGGG